MSVSAVKHVPKFSIWSVVSSVVKRYETIIGLTSVREAQNNVLEAEKKFSEFQNQRRQIQTEMHQVQERRKEIRSELDRTPRSEDRYLQLLTEEHAVIKNEKSLYERFRLTELAERESFSMLSSRLRESHEKERERVERTKYWSIIGSIMGALIGIGGTTINNWKRMNELKTIVRESTNPQQMETILSQLANVVASQQQQVTTFVGDLKTMLNMCDGAAVKPRSNQDIETLLSTKQYEEIIETIREQNANVNGEMDQIKKMIAAEHGYSVEDAGTIVYVGPEMEKLLNRTEKNLEWSLKKNAIMNVLMVYTALIFLVPFLAATCKGD
ncbi:unnamed protein product [Soboliphyme baturini]|uniref:Coiled-coil domain-containing protein 51 n=1 Tax=Soboliphyme baturini TaxID=241478 RepID=A0A183IDG7_9BILA|nr:unnamed protein product [Soboliphyme baturini]